MKKEILERIALLGGDTTTVKGVSLQQDLLSIVFDSVLYARPTDTPWCTAEEDEPIYGIGDFINENAALFHADKQALYDKLIDKYYRLTDEGYGQDFWIPQLFTPFKEGTEDYAEWHDDFISQRTDLSEVIAVTGDPRPDFIRIINSYGFPDNLYICLSDPDQENPTVFGTDHEVFFSEVSNRGTLQDLFESFMTREELIEIVRNRIE